MHGNQDPASTCYSTQTRNFLSSFDLYLYLYVPDTVMTCPLYFAELGMRPQLLHLTTQLKRLRKYMDDDSDDLKAR